MPVILNTLVDDILMRDIAVRHSVRDVVSLRQLTAFLITNIGNLVSANKLFSHSLKVQARNPKKVYVMDMGLYTENSVTTSENTGRRLENLIFLHLRKKYKQIFYYKDRVECDFERTVWCRKPYNNLSLERNLSKW